MSGTGTAKVVASIMIGGSVVSLIYYAFFDGSPAATVFYLACILMGAVLFGHPELMLVERTEDMDFSSFATIDYLMLAAALTLGVLSVIAMLLS